MEKIMLIILKIFREILLGASSILCLYNFFIMENIKYAFDMFVWSVIYTYFLDFAIEVNEEDVQSLDEKEKMNDLEEKIETDDLENDENKEIIKEIEKKNNVIIEQLKFLKEYLLSYKDEKTVKPKVKTNLKK